MYKIILPFPTCFWPTDKHFLNFLPSVHTSKPDPFLVQYFELNQKQTKALTTYMSDMANYSSLMPVCNEPILIGYSTNRAAELMERLSDDEAHIVFLCQLAHYDREILVAQDPEDLTATAQVLCAYVCQTKYRGDTTDLVLQFDFIPLAPSSSTS